MTMTSRICNKEADVSALRKTAAFLAEYASLLSGCGATCIRIGKKLGLQNGMTLSTYLYSIAKSASRKSEEA